MDSPIGNDFRQGQDLHGDPNAGPVARRVLPRVAIAAALAFLALVALSIHGFSVGKFDDFVPQKTGTYSFPHVGRAQKFRSDEFMVSLPLVAAQCRAKSFFPAFNDECFIEPTDMFVMTPPCPVFDWTLPGQFPNWGYFLFGLERGMAWNWWSRYLLLPVLAFSFFLLCTGRMSLSAIAALSLTLAAPTQWWTTTVPYHLAFLFGSALSAAALRDTDVKAGILVAALCLLVCVSSFLFFFYPPFQFPFLVLFACMFPWIPKRRSNAAGAGTHAVLRWVALAVVLLCIAAEAWYFLSRHGTTLEIISRSVYPGRRCERGGPFEDGITYSLFKFISLFDSFYAPGRTTPCPCAMFFAPFLPVAACGAWLSLPRNGGGRIGRVLPIIAFTMFLALWTFFPLPKFVGKATLFKIVPPGRSAVVLSFAMLMLMFLEFDALGKRKRPFPWPWALGVSLASTAICTALCLYMMQTRKYFLLSGWMGAPALLAVGIALYFTMSLGLLRASSRIFYPACILVAILSGWFVNPLCIGASPLTDKRLVSLAHDVEAKHGKGVWIVGNEYISQFLVANGFQCLGGVHSQPRPEIWSKIDPLYRQARVWNRYAHLLAAVTKTDHPQASLLNEAKVIWNLGDKEAKILGARYLLDPSPRSGLPDNAIRVAKEDGHTIYRLDWDKIPDDVNRFPVDAPCSARALCSSDSRKYSFPFGCVLGARMVRDTPTNVVARVALQFAPDAVKSVPARISLGVTDAKGNVLFECPGLLLSGLQSRGSSLSSQVVEVDVSGAIPPDFAFLEQRGFVLVFRDAFAKTRLKGRDSHGGKVKRIPVGR